MIFNISELDTINFDEVLETSKGTIRTSNDGTKTFVKWEGNIPTTVNNLQTSEGPYPYEDMLNILSSTEWTSNDFIEWVQ